MKNGSFMTNYQHPLTKKRVREEFPTREAAKAHKADIERSFTKRNFNNLMGLNIGELLNIYMLEVPNNSLNKYTKLHTADFAETFGDFSVDELTTDVLKTWLDQIQRENKIKDISVRKIKCDFDGFFKYLVDKEIISASPLTEIFYSKTVPSIGSRNILSANDIKEILRLVKEFSPGYLYPLIKMFAETGAKTSEVMDLKWGDMDFENKKIKFNKTTSSCERELTLSDELISILEKRKAKTAYVFTNINNEPFTAAKIARALTEFRVRSRSEMKWRVCDFRHSYAVNFLSKGRALKDLQYILGHQNVFQTKQLYGEVTKNSLTKNYAKLSDLYSADTP
jgi:integrase